MPTKNELESARRRAPSIADQVQLRIIAAKQARGETLYPDEEDLLSRHQAGEVKPKVSLEAHGDAKVLLFQNENFGKLSYTAKDALVVRFAKILVLAKDIKRHFEQKGLSSDFDKVDELEVIRGWDGTISENIVLWAFHLANGRTLEAEIAKELISKELDA